MVDIMDGYKSFSISIGTVTKNTKMSRFVPDHLKIKKICRHAVTYHLIY